MIHFLALTAERPSALAEIAPGRAIMLIFGNKFKVTKINKERKGV
jgi:hypothetical protein